MGVWRYRLFRRSPDSPRTPEEWLDALIADGWQTWAPGRGSWAQMGDQQVYSVNLRRWEPKRQGTPLPSAHDDNDSR